MPEHIRPAVAGDVDSMASLASERRAEYAGYQPQFWRPAPDAEHRHRPFLAALMASDDVIALVREDGGQLTGFIILTLKPAPPVYDPGGLSGLVDDFAVLPGRWPTTGPRLLRAALGDAAERGAVQSVVVTAHLDEPKRAMLRDAGLQLASEWWVTSATS
jgi:hypothetical protein